MFQKILNITFVLLLSIWLFGTYEFSNTNTHVVFEESIVTDPSEAVIDTRSTTTPEKIPYVQKATTTPKTKASAKPIVTKIMTTASTTPLVSKPIAPKPPADFVKVNDSARLATVNILCVAKGSELSPISGTGIVISPEGVILTNAHVGLFFLLKNWRQKDFMECSIRTGSPAYPKYRAELVYLSPEWVSQNQSILKDQNPKGTGEYDFAFLRITDALDGTPLPTFSFIPANVSEYVDRGEPVLLAGYPAGFLGGLAILQSLSVTTAVTNIQDYFTFKANTIDLLSVGGTVLSQKGASGGGVVDGNTTLLGIISTSSNADTTNMRELNAISIPYINRTLQTEIGMAFQQFLTQDNENFANSFNTTKAPGLLKILTEVFNTTN